MAVAVFFSFLGVKVEAEITLASHRSVAQLKGVLITEAAPRSLLGSLHVHIESICQEQPLSTSASFGLTFVTAPSSCLLISLLSVQAFIPHLPIFISHPSQGKGFTLDFSLPWDSHPWSP